MIIRRTAAFIGLFVAIATTPAVAFDNDYGVRDPATGTITGLDVFTPNFSCPGKHLSKVTFTSFSLSDDFQFIPWVSVPRAVEYEAGAQMPSVRIDVNVGQLGPGRHAGVVSLECVACDQGNCKGQKIAAPVSVEIPYPLEFGASSADAQFGGLVNGQIVTAEELLPNVLNDIKKSSFGQLPGSQPIFDTLENEYFENSLSDISFIRTVDKINPAKGTFGTEVVAVDGNEEGPGEGAYTVNQIGGEEIYLGVDASTKGIGEARNNPSDYYVFTIDGEIAVVKKEDLVHNLMHEGLHAARAGAYNVTRPSGTSSGGSIEEEQEGFRAGNAAAAALGLGQDSTVPTKEGYNAGSNPNYPLLFPSLLNAPATPPAAGSTPAPSTTPSTEGASGDQRQGSLLPSYNPNPQSGHCSNNAIGLDCEGTPNFAVICDEADPGCSFADSGLAEPCSLDGGQWLCSEMPPAVVQCSQNECTFDSKAVADACVSDGNGFACSELPGWGLSCESGECALTVTSRPETEVCVEDECDDGLEGDSVPEPGFCVDAGNGLVCDGAPNIAMVCDEADDSCDAESIGSTQPCYSRDGDWVCSEIPPAVVHCSDGVCNYDEARVDEVCTDDGARFTCSEMPAYGLSCRAGVCRPGFVNRFEPVECVASLCDAVLDAASSETGPALYGASQNLECGMGGSGDVVAFEPIKGPLRDEKVFFFHAPNPDTATGSARTFNDLFMEFNDPTRMLEGPSLDATTRQPNSIDYELAAEYDEVGGTLEERLRGLGDPYAFMFVPNGNTIGQSSWPRTGSQFNDVGTGQGPFKGVIQAPRNVAGTFSFAGSYYRLQGRSYGSVNFQTPAAGLAPTIEPYVNRQVRIDSVMYTSLMYEDHEQSIVINTLVASGIDYSDGNPCRVVLLPNDPNYLRTGRHGGNSWGASEDDQWAIKRVGFTNDDTSAWNLVDDNAQPVVVAVIDTGLDWHHEDLEATNIWTNQAEIADNGIDDDRNGYVDDVIGWDFMANGNKPWDHDGHGTVVTGIIAAAQNETGIAGINPHAKIMVLKAVNNFGTTRASYIAEAIVYAVDNGARVINVSVGGPHESAMEQAAIDYARSKGVLIVAAAGNDGKEIGEFGPGGNDNVLTVGATYFDDRAAGFSNFGNKVDIVAPGVDVLSLRARYTDANFRPGVAENVEYTLGDNVVGDDKRYLRVSGTSFSTPIVSGVASLLLSQNPELSADDVERILTQTATDVDFMGKDKYTGHGMVDARAALSIGSAFSIVAHISGIEAVPADYPQYIHVKGTINADGFKRAWMQIGAGENPGGWRYVGQKRKYPIVDGTLGKIPINQFSGSDLWQIVVNVEHKNGIIKRAVYPIKLR